MTFDDVIGQQEAKQRLQSMYGSGKMPHALLLCGPAGVGKMALAMALACHVLRQSAKNNVEAMLEKMEHPDLHFTFPTIKPSSMSADRKPVSDDFILQWHQMIAESPYFTMDKWMSIIGAENQQAIITTGESDNLNRKLALKASQGGYKVSVIWLPERMNTECANKLLKLIEEPPAYTLFIMVSEEPDKIIETIRSRTQRIDIKRIDNESMVQALMSKRALQKDDAVRIARMANGSWNVAVEALMADSENEKFLDMFRQLMRLAYGRHIKELKLWVDAMQGYGREKQKRFLIYLLRLIRENFIYNFGEPDLCYMSLQEEEFSRKFARFINEDNVLQIYELANKAIRDIGQNANAKIVFFDFALQMIVLLMQKK